MIMKKNYDLWSSLTFKTLSYRKNFNFTVEDDNFITELEGTVTKVGIGSGKPPFFVGEYNYSIWNFGLANLFDVDLLDVLENYTYEDSYIELFDMVKENKFSFEEIDRLVVLHNFILHPDYRKKGITEEFIEALYREHFVGGNNHIVALVKPIQNNTVYFENYISNRVVRIRHTVYDDGPYEEMSSFKYFGIGELENKTDIEKNHYQLYALAARCGFRRMGESNLFYFTPQKIQDRLEDKRLEFPETLLT